MRNQNIELLRILGALLIVCYHSGLPGGEATYAGLSIFILLSVQFEVGPLWSRATSVKTRATRLLVPWAIWSAIFGVLNTVRGKPPFPHAGGLSEGILYGAMPHLWYLPFIFVVLCFIDIAKRWISQRFLEIIALLAFFTVALTIPIWRPHTLLAGAPYAQWAQASVAVIVGVLLGVTNQTSRWILTLLVVSATLLIASYLPYQDKVVWPNLLALGLVVLAVKSPSFISQSINIRFFSDAMFGVYIVHLPILLVFGPVTIRFGYIGPIAAFIASVGLVLAFRHAAQFMKRFGFASAAKQLRLRHPAKLN